MGKKAEVWGKYYSCIINKSPNLYAVSKALTEHTKPVGFNPNGRHAKDSNCQCGFLLCTSILLQLAGHTWVNEQPFFLYKLTEGLDQKFR